MVKYRLETIYKDVSTMSSDDFEYLISELEFLHTMREGVRAKPRIIERTTGRIVYE